MKTKEELETNLYGLGLEYEVYLKLLKSNVTTIDKLLSFDLSNFSDEDISVIMSCLNYYGIKHDSQLSPLELEERNKRRKEPGLYDEIHLSIDLVTTFSNHHIVRYIDLLSLPKEEIEEVLKMAKIDITTLISMVHKRGLAFDFELDEKQLEERKKRSEYKTKGEEFYYIYMTYLCDKEAYERSVLEERKRAKELVHPTNVLSDEIANYEKVRKKQWFI